MADECLPIPRLRVRAVPLLSTTSEAAAALDMHTSDQGTSPMDLAPAPFSFVGLYSILRGQTRADNFDYGWTVCVYRDDGIRDTRHI